MNRDPSRGFVFDSAKKETVAFTFRREVCTLLIELQKFSGKQFPDFVFISVAQQALLENDGCESKL